MKKLFILVLFMPLLSWAQGFEFSEMAGYSAPTIPNPSAANVSLVHGFSNQLTANYYFAKHFSAGAFYELNSWGLLIHSLGITVDAHYRHVYAGLNVSDFNFATAATRNVHETYWGVTDSTTYKYQPSLAYGLHIGYYQRLTPHLGLQAQLGYNVAAIKVQEHSPEFNNIGPVTFPNGNYTVPVTYYYILLGVDYRL
jgi:hypothetical protein